METKREVPNKNYIILGIILVITGVILYYFYLWYLTYEEGKLNSPIMDRYLQVINYNELEDYLVENKDTNIYVSILENEDIRSFELEFKKVIKDNTLSRKILYLNFTDVYNDKRLLKEASNKYKVGQQNIKDVPCLLIFEEGYLVDIYSIKDNQYDLDNFVYYLDEQGLLE